MTARRPLDDRRRAIFLQILRETGSVSAACRGCTPHGDNKEGRPGHRTIIDAIRRDPAFAEQVEEAKDEAIGRIEAEIAKRAFQPDERPIFAKDGKLLGSHKSWREANQLLLRQLEALNPEKWARKTHIKGEVAHRHDHRVGIVMFQVAPEDLRLLEDEQERLLLTELLVKLEDLKKEKDRERRILPASGAASDEADRRDVD